MNGKELLEGFSFVDEQYVNEAEYKTIHRSVNTPWMRWVSAAACLCVIAFSAVSYRFWNPTHLTEGGSDITLGQTEQIQEGADSNSISESGVGEVPSVILRVDAGTEYGFTGTVEKLVDTDIFEPGMVLNVVFSEEINAEHRDVESSKAQDSIVIGDRYAEGLLVWVQFSYYDEETGTIYVDLISQIEPYEGKGN